MPFIRGRYHINAVAGEALEAAREAEAALLALHNDPQSAQQNGDDDFAGHASGHPSASHAKGPIHRVEIEAAETVPAHSGRAERGFVARVHRATPPSDDQADGFADETPANASRRAGSDNYSRVTSSSHPETHVFTHHHDLVNFLRDEFANDRKQ